MHAQFDSVGVIWFILGVILLVLEFVVPGVILAFFGIGAIITAGLTWIGVLETTSHQIPVFLISSLLLLVTLRKYLSKHFRGGVITEGGDDAHRSFVGKRGRVTKRISPDSIDGRIDLDGTEWKATSSVAIEAGSIVEVEAKDNITLRVKPGVDRETDSCRTAG